MISNVDVPHPVEYLPTGDHGLLMAWASVPPVFFLGGSITTEVAHKVSEMIRGQTLPRALICLEDGRPVLATLDEFKFDYRYDANKGEFVDVSGLGAATEEGDGADTDQEASDDGSQGVPGLVSDAD